jgi:WD40 repeat protein
MSTYPHHRIFISYAHRDGKDLALRLKQSLKATGLDAWLDSQRLRGGSSWTTEIETALDASDVVLALLTPGSYVSDICRAEQLRSLRKGKCVIPVLGLKNADIPLHLETKNYRDFTASSDYEDRLEQLLGDISAGDGIKISEIYRETYVTTPPLPVNFVARPEELAALRATLITDAGTRHIALTALKGMGGIGKTVLAQALCHEEVVQQAFPDGIIWITVGKESASDIVTRMREVGKALKDDLTRYDNELGCTHQYRSTIRRKAALIVLDDVWRAPDVEPFRAESSRSCLLFTTRNASIAATVGAQEHMADLLTQEQSREILALWSGLKTDKLPSQTDNLIHECGRLPLALSMIGAMLKGKPPAFWDRVLDLLGNADLEKIKAQFPDYPHWSLLRAIQVSVDALDQIARERYLALAVLLEDTPVLHTIQQTLWNLEKGEALETAEQFVSLSLAQRDGDAGAIHLHDLQLDYVRAQYPNRETLALIHEAIRLSAHVIAKDESQFASQVAGRLLPCRDQPGVREFSDSLAEGAPRPWVRLLHPALYPPGTALIRTLEGHSDSVYCVAMSPDGRRTISASLDRTLKVWDLETGRELRTLQGHSDSVYGVAVSPDGRRAVSASSDKMIKVWDLETGRELRTLQGHSDSVISVAVSPDGRRAVSASSDKTLKVWDLETGRELRTLQGHSRRVEGVALSPDGQRAVSASWDNTLKVWDLETGRELRTLQGHSGSVRGVAVNPNGRRAISTSDDKTLKVWDLETGRELCTLKGHSRWVRGVAVNPNGRRAISTSDDKTLKVWDLETGRELRTLQGHFSAVHGVAVSPDGMRAVSASGDNTLKVWDLKTGREVPTRPSHSSAVRGVAVTRDGMRAVSASGDNTLKVWDLETGREVRTLQGHSDAVRGVAVTRDGMRAVSASSDKTLKVWDLETGGQLRTLQGHTRGVMGVAVTPDGRHVVSASANKALRVWDLETGGQLRMLQGHSGGVMGVALSPDGQYAVSASADKTLKVWDLETGRYVRALQGHSDWVMGVAVSPDGRRAVSACRDKTLRVWDLETGDQLRVLQGHAAGVNSVAVSPDGMRAVSASSDKMIKVWDLELGANVATFTCDSSAQCCAFAGSRSIVSGDSLGRVHFFELMEKS